MDLKLSDEQALYRESTQRLLGPAAPVPGLRNNYTNGEGFDRSKWAEGAELGWAAMLVPEDFGGAGDTGEGILDLAIVAEEMGRVVAGGPLVPVSVVAAALTEAANAESFGETIESIVGGETIATWAVDESTLEPWDIQSPKVTAEIVGDRVVINGTKVNVEAADQADLFLVTAQSADGVVQVLVPADADGVTIENGPALDMIRHFSQVTFAKAEVPLASIVEPAKDIASAIERQLEVALVLQLAETAGVVGHVFEMTLQWTRDRYSFGRPLASYQVIKHRIADLKILSEAIFSTSSAAAHAVHEKSDDAAKLVSVAKSYVGDKSVAAIQDCIQLHGAIGVTWEHNIHIYLRRAVANRAAYGTPEEHRKRLADLLGY